MKTWMCVGGMLAVACFQGLAESASLWFDGVDGYVVTPASINESGTQSCTLEAWVKPEALGALRHVLSTDLGGRQWSILQGADNRWHVYGGGTDVNTGFNVVTGRWQHVALAITAAGAGSSLKFYLDSASFTHNAVGFYTNAAPSLAIGATPARSGLFRGCIQEVRAWSYARQAAQIQAALTNALRGTEPGLVAYYRLDEGRGERLYDQTTNQAHARFAGLRTNSWGGGVAMTTPPSFEEKYAGLWGGPAVITAVNQPYPTALQQGNAAWDTTSPTNAGASFPLRLLLHVDSSGHARLLQRVIVVGSPTNVVVNRSDVVGGGAIITNKLIHYQLYSDEARVPSTASGEVYRISSTAFPVMAPVPMSGWPRVSGEVVLRADDPVNPFVHVYHPDHNASRNDVSVTRRITLTFADSDPDNTNNLAWRVTEWGGIYEETISGLHQNPLYLKGMFRVHRSNREGKLQ